MDCVPIRIHGYGTVDGSRGYTDRTKDGSDPAAMSGERVFPGECSRAVPGPFVTVPPQPATAKPGQLTQEQLRQYFDVGYVKVENFFTPAELDPVKAEIEELVEDLAQRLLKAGKIKNLYREYGFYQRLTMINKEFPGANVVLHKLPKLPKSFRSVWASPRLLNIVEQLLGTSDIMGHPVYNLRTKTPHNEEVTVPWHQDNGYISNDGYFNHVVTAWIPLLDADQTNGCMQLARGGHRSGRVAKHTCCAGGTWYVMLDEQEMVNTLGVDLERDLVVEPVNYGSLLLFSNMLPHRSLDNTSNDIRWSLDLRWNRAQDPTGFFGVKDGIRMRSSENPDDYAITEEAWAAFDGVSRHTECGVVSDEYKASEFDTTIPGPWMNKWEIVHMNRHVAALANADKLDIPPVMG